MGTQKQSSVKNISFQQNEDIGNVDVDDDNGTKRRTMQTQFVRKITPLG